MGNLFFLLAAGGFTIFFPLYRGLYAVLRKEYRISKRKTTTGKAATIAGYIMLVGVGVFLVNLILSLLSKRAIFLLIGFAVELLLMWISETYATSKWHSSRVKI